MILSFSKEQFVDRIIKKTKKTTIREDKTQRWKVGMSIQFWKGSPRNTRAKNKPYWFAVGECTKIDQIEIRYTSCGKGLQWVAINDKYISYQEIEQLAIDDGFDSIVDFMKWFSEDFKGRIIHWELKSVLI